MFNILKRCDLDCYDQDIILKIRNIVDNNLSNYPSSITSTRVSVYTILLWQIISNITGSLRIMRYDTRSDTNLETLINIIDNKENAIIFIETPPSLLTKSTSKTTRNNIEKINTHSDEILQRITNGLLLGTTYSEESKTLYIFINNKLYITNTIIIFATLLLYKYLIKIDNFEKEKELLTELKNYFSTQSEPFRVDHQDIIKEIFLKFLKNNKEYTIDIEKELIALIEKKQSEKINEFKYKTEVALKTLQDCLTQVANATKTYNGINEIYKALLLQNKETNKYEFEIRETIDLLKRSKYITDYGIDSPKICFTVCQPLKINSEEDWIRIEEKAIKNNYLKDLIHQTFIDKKYELKTEATISLDIIANRIERYTNADLISDPNAIPNPHISHYNCFGTHTNVIANLLAEGNYMEALEQAIEAEAYLNWSDAAVINVFGYYFDNKYKDAKVFKNLETNEYISLKDYIDESLKETTCSND